VASQQTQKKCFQPPPLNPATDWFGFYNFVVFTGVALFLQLFPAALVGATGGA
jgi:hypothetical protein